MTETMPLYSLYSSAVVLLFGIILLPSLSLAFCFEEAGRLYGLNPRLLWSIAKVESDFNPTAINRREKDFDYGVMQINSWWYTRMGKERWMALLIRATTSKQEPGYWLSPSGSMEVSGKAWGITMHSLKSTETGMSKKSMTYFRL
jgi:hypothetical protein